MSHGAGEPIDSNAPTADGAAPALIAEPDTPFRVGRYEARRLIARHGQGILYEGFDPELERTVAIKVVVSRGEGDDAPLRCEREAKALAKLNHPHTVPVFDSGETRFGSRPARFFVMEFLKGARTIVGYADARRLGAAQRVRLLLPVCRAVGAGHAAGLLHRDLKPANILVDRAGKPSVIDFGLVAGLSARADAELRDHEFGWLVGTVPYMAPEQFELDPDQLDERTDVYAMGLVAFELLTGEMPYEVRDLSPQDAAAVVRGAPPRRAGRIRSELRGDLGAILSKALEKDPRRRYQSMEAVADDLERWLRAASVAARGAGPVQFGVGAIRRAAYQWPRASLVVLWLAAACTISLVAASPMYHALPVNRWFSAAAALLERDFGSFESVRAVVTAMDTPLGPVAERLGIAGADAGDPSSLRAFYGEVLARLAQAGPAVVALDIGFQNKDDAGDPSLVRGLTALRDAGCPVVMGAWPWPRSAGTAPEEYDSDVVPLVDFGGVTGQFTPAGSWEVDLAVAPPGESAAMLSLPLAAVAALHAEGSDVTAEIDLVLSTVRLRFWRRDAGVSTLRLAGQEEVRATRVVISDRGRDEEEGVQPGSSVALLLANPPSDEAYRRATTDAAALFELDPEELKARFHGKVVLLGRPDEQDRHTRPDGRILHGYQVHMAVIESLSRGSQARYPVQSHLSIVTFAGAALGLFGAVPALRIRWRRWGLILVAIASMMVLAGVVYQRAGVLVNPVPMALAMIFTAEGAAMVARVRRLRGRSVFIQSANLGG